MQKILNYVATFRRNDLCFLPSLCISGRSRNERITYDDSMALEASVGSLRVVIRDLLL
jgi:hypothetical protein